MFYCYVTSNQEYGWRLWRAALFRKREKGDERQKLVLGWELEPLAIHSLHDPASYSLLLALGRTVLVI